MTFLRTLEIFFANRQRNLSPNHPCLARRQRNNAAKRRTRTRRRGGRCEWRQFVTCVSLCLCVYRVKRGRQTFRDDEIKTRDFFFTSKKIIFWVFFSILFWKKSQFSFSIFEKRKKKRRRRRDDIYFIEVNTRYGHIIFNDRRKNEEEEEEERRRRLCRYVFSILCLLLLLVLVRIPLGRHVVRIYYATHHERHHEAHRTRFPNVVSFSTRVRLLHVFLMRVLRFDSFGFDENIVARCRRYCVFIDVRVDSCDRSWNRDAEPKWNERK